MKKISIILGTRPEAIKLAPVIKAVQSSDSLTCHLCVTGQHRGMLDQVLEVFDLTPDVDLNVMVSGQTLSGLTSRLMDRIDAYLTAEKPDAVIVQGDTTTVLTASLAAFYHKIPIGHVEAGLRTGNMCSPWPEEANRVLASRLCRWHFAPTNVNRNNLLREGVDEGQVFVTGNTVIDALFMGLELCENQAVSIAGLPECGLNFIGDRKMVLITGHRRENFGGGFENICNAIASLAVKFTDVQFIYPVHLNPNVRETVGRILNPSHAENNNIHLIEPQPYLQFISLMKRADLILTDSGGVQEEAPSLNKPVLVMRDTTERPEAVDAGSVRLVGTSCEAIIDGASEILNRIADSGDVPSVVNPYGDGNAAFKILEVLENHFSVDKIS